MAAQRGHQWRKFLGYAGRLDVPALADGDIDAVEADSSGSGGQVLALDEMQGLGEDRYLEFRLGAGRAAHEQCASGQQRAPRNGKSVCISSAHGLMITL